MEGRGRVAPSKKIGVTTRRGLSYNVAGGRYTRPRHLYEEKP